jgi:adhesin HecA-like repeat protein
MRVWFATVVLASQLAALAGGAARADAPASATTENADLPDEPTTIPTSSTPPKPTEVPRRPDASIGSAFAGPFTSSRLFAMPVADTVGPYVLSLSGDGSLLQQPGLLTSAGVFALGFGDLAQLEYRHSEAISVTNVDAPVPGVGVQLKLPIPDRLNVPAVGIAFRLGVPRSEAFSGTTVTETVTDFYAVGRLRFSFAPWLTLHGGLRVSAADVQVSGDSSLTASQAEQKRLLWLPTGGYEIQMNKVTRIVGEIALAPQFATMPGTATPPLIRYGVLGRFGLRWAVIPALWLDASIGYQLDDAYGLSIGGSVRDVVQQWDIRLGAEVFVPWGALACRAVGVFCQ